jgi:hypothetical protein
MSDDELLRFGFIRAEDGAFLIPMGWGSRLVPTGRYLEIQFVIPDGHGHSRTISTVIHRTALKAVDTSTPRARRA